VPGFLLLTEGEVKSEQTRQSGLSSFSGSSILLPSLGGGPSSGRFNAGHPQTITNQTKRIGNLGSRNSHQNNCQKSLS
jgi:hypothetical protein